MASWIASSKTGPGDGLSHPPRPGRKKYLGNREECDRLSNAGPGCAASR